MLLYILFGFASNLLQFYASYKKTLMKTLFILLITFLTLTSCNTNDDIDQIICTEEFVYGINVTLIDSSTSNPITMDVDVKIEDGDFEEILMTLDGIDAFFGAGERPGNYIITVTSSNYQTYISDSIAVFNDLCHVISETIEIQLTPN